MQSTGGRVLGGIRVQEQEGWSMADDQEFAAVGADEVVPELVVKEGEDIDYRVVLCFYLLADLGG